MTKSKAQLQHRRDPASSRHVFHPDRWPVWRRELNRILHTEGPRPLYELVARVEHLVPPDKGAHNIRRQRDLNQVKKTRNTDEQDARSGQRTLVFSGIHSSITTGFYDRWVTEDDVTMIGLGEAGKQYYEERRAQGNQPAPVQRDGTGPTGTD